MQPQANKAPQTPPAGKGGYGKRPVWQWVIIYVIVAVIVYGVAFAAYHHYHKTTSDTNGNGLY